MLDCGHKQWGERRGPKVSWKGMMFRMKLTLEVEKYVKNTWRQRCQQVAVMLGSLSFRYNNYFTRNVEIGGHKSEGNGERREKKVIPTHHSTSCSCGVVERFIDHLGMWSVRADEGVEQKERGRGREQSRPIWMTASEGIRFFGLIDNDIPAWTVR